MPNYHRLVIGGYFSSDPNEPSVPLSIRTNNPGALNLAGWIKAYPGFVDYREATPTNRTVIFEAPEYGVAAWWELLNKYRAALGDKNFTIREIIRKYCGKGREKEAVEYTAFVCGKAGVTGNKVVDITDHPGLLRIARAFYWFEAGRESPLLDDQLHYGFDFGQRRGSGGAPLRDLAAVSRIAAEAMAEAPAARRARLVGVAGSEADKHLKWTGSTSEAEKYLKPFRAPMQRLGQIGKEPVFFNWCAAFVTWCCRQAGYSIPDQPVGYAATMALVASWDYWGKQQKLAVLPDRGDLQAGDILLYHWTDKKKIFNHIGIFSRWRPDSGIEALEGNASNRTATMKRDFTAVKDVVRLPD
jgi:hypothetical protein